MVSTILMIAVLCTMLIGLYKVGMMIIGLIPVIIKVIKFLFVLGIGTIVVSGIMFLLSVFGFISIVII